MYLDQELIFSDKQAVTATGDTASTNIIDLGAQRDIGKGEDIELYFITNAAATSGGAATVTFVLQTSPDNSTWSDILVSPPVPVASLTAGFTRKFRNPRNTQRYLRAAYRVGTAALTAGTFTAGINLNVDDQAIYPHASRVVA